MSTLDLKGDRAHWANYEGSTCFHQEPVPESATRAGTSFEQHDASTRPVERHTWNSWRSRSRPRTFTFRPRPRPHSATLATGNADGRPQSTVIFVKRDRDTVVFSTIKGRLKSRNMMRDPRVSLWCWRTRACASRSAGPWTSKRTRRRSSSTRCTTGTWAARHRLSSRRRSGLSFELPLRGSTAGRPTPTPPDEVQPGAVAEAQTTAH